MGTIGTEKSDGELVNASRRGEHAAFGQLVARYQDLVCAVSYSSTGDHVLSEDVAQETFIAAWRQLAALRDIGRLRPWLCWIARNLARKARKARRRDELVEPETSPELIAEGNPFDLAARGQVERLVSDALARVPDTYREVLVLYYRENQSIREVADALDTSEQAVMQRLSRGRRYLADSVSELVERSLRAEHRPRRDLVAAVLAAIAVIAVAPHVDASTPPAGQSPSGSISGRPKAAKGSTMLKLALAATAAAAVGTTVYLLHSHYDHASSATTLAARPALRYGAGKHGLAHPLALGPSAAPRQIASRSVAESDLAFLPADADAVFGFNFAQLQKSALWQQYVAPEIANAKDLKMFADECGFDPVKSLGSVSVGVKGLGANETPVGTVVIHGLDKTNAMACFENHARPNLEDASVHVAVDNGVLLISSPDNTSHAGLTFTDDTTAVLVFGPLAETRDGVESVLSGQHSLRDSPQFADTLQKVNTDASLWMVLSDASSLTDTASTSLAPYMSQKLGTVYASLDVSDSLSFDAGIHLSSPQAVAAVLSMIQTKIEAIDPNRALRQYFDQLDIFADGSDLIYSVAIAGDQLVPLATAVALKASMTASIEVGSDAND